MEKNNGDGYWQKPTEVIEHGLADFIISEELEDDTDNCNKCWFSRIKKLFRK